MGTGCESIPPQRKWPGGIFRPSCFVHFKYFCLLPSLPRRHCTFTLLPLMNYDFGKLYCGLDFKLIFQYYMFFTETFKSIAVSLISGRPSTWSQIYQSAVRDFFRSDHYRFWNAEPSLPAVLVTDSTNFRGYMQQCYHEECDDISHVTSEMMTFLGQTADSLVEVATNMTSEKCQMKRTGKVMWSCCSSRRPYIKLNGISQSQAGVCVKLFH